MSREPSGPLKLLVEVIWNFVENGVMSEEFLPYHEPWFKWKVDKFEYTDKGVADFNSHVEKITRPSWSTPSNLVDDRVKNSKEYSLALDQLYETFGKSEKVNRDLGSFTWKIIYRFFRDQKFDKTQTDLVVANFIKELRDEPLRYGANIELQGVALESKFVEMASGVTLRQPTVEDLEKEVPANSPITRPTFGPSMSAILTIEFLGRSAVEIQSMVEQAVTILGLFKVGGVRWLSYRMFSDSVTDVMASATLTSGRSDMALETYLISEDDTEKLRQFWKSMRKSVPSSFYEYGSAKSDFLTIAFRRYEDALLQNGIVERRIASSMMGLEALFLKRGETQELVYRLSTRISKLLGMIEHNQHEVKRELIDAYKVRNIFVHGGQLSYQEKKKLESKYKDVKDVLLNVLEYLRTALIVLILASKSKDEFIDLLDDSLIDRKKEDELNSILSPVRELVGKR